MTLPCLALGPAYVRLHSPAVAAYHQQQMAALLRIDGEDEFAVYVAPVG